MYRMQLAVGFVTASILGFAQDPDPCPALVKQCGRDLQACWEDLDDCESNAGGGVLFPSLTVRKGPWLDEEPELKRLYRKAVRDKKRVERAAEKVDKKAEKVEEAVAEKLETQQDVEPLIREAKKSLEEYENAIPPEFAPPE